MKITRIQIDRYGLWRNLDLPLDPAGISVLYGPNEAGKSTLLNFIRGVLYGFPAAETHGHARESAFLGGTLHVLHADRPLEIARRRGDRKPHHLTVTGCDRAQPADEILSQVTAGTNRRTFQNLFALGLSELQQLATLNSSEMAEHLYAATLGADGKRLLAAIRETESNRGTLCNGDAHGGSLAALMDRDSTMAGTLREHGAQRDEYDRLCVERKRLGESLADMKSRQAGMQSQLRGHRFMQRVYDPWLQVRECEGELADVPAIAAFPPDGLQRLHRLDAEISSENRCRRTLRSEIEELEARRATLLPDPTALKGIPALRRIVERREQIEQAAADRDASRQTVAEARRALDDACAKLGPDWNRQRLEAVDGSPRMQHELLQAAGGFQKAIVRRGRFRQALKSATEAFGKLRAKVEQGRGRFGDQTVADAVANEERHSESRRLQARATELRQALARDDRTELVPQWFRRVLWFFAVAGGLVALVGLVTAFTVNAWSGLVLCLAGLTGLGASWGLQLQTESTARDTNAARQTELQQVEQELLAIGDPGDQSAEVATQPERIARLVDLESFHELRGRFERRRRRMTQLRQRFAAVKQNFSQARELWCDAQKRAGLDVILKLEDAFAHWQAVFEARQRLTRLQAAEPTARQAERRCERFAQFVVTGLSRSQDRLKPITTNSLDECQQRLSELEAARDETRRIREEIRKRRQEAGQYTRSLRTLDRRLGALLMQGGAADREEFEQRADAVARRAELEELLTMARDDLAAVAAEEPELAVVEEDLAAYDAAEHAECVRALELELSDLSRDLQDAHEQLGSVKQALSELAADDRETKLRIERGRLETDLAAELETWLAERLVAQTLDVVKSRFERTHQPAVLAAASDSLQRFTRGRYQRLWAPLGRCRLFVEDRWDENWELDELSGGTREQVFLALRLALVEEAAQRGVELPLVLDDVLVNFDRQRTEAAVETLRHVASSGRQIVFLTCHEHVADAFRRIGVTPLELPDQPRERERRIAG